MSMAYLRSLFVAEKDAIEFRGKCHDCGGQTSVICIRNGEDIHIAGGAYWRELDKDFVKCEACFEKQPMLTNYIPCEIYSRVTGYLRPVKQWNPGKREEFKERKYFKI